jgi:pilus assembly protein Flp/PilA
LGRPLRPPFGAICLQFDGKLREKPNVSSHQLLEFCSYVTPRVQDERHTQGLLAMQLIKRFLQNQVGATAIEYGLIAAGISIAIIAVVNGLGTQLNNTFSSVSSQLK